MSLRLLLLSPEPGLPSQCLEFDDAGTVIARKWLDPEHPATAAVAAPAARNVLVVPGPEASALWLDLPAYSSAQALAAARLVLEERLALAGEKMHLAIGSLTTTTHRLVVTTRHATMQAWLEHAAQLGVVPDVVLPDYLLLPVSEEGTVNVHDAGERWSVRGQVLAFSAEPALAELIIGERRRVQLDGEPWEHAAAAAARAPEINLLQQEFAVASGDPQGLRAYLRALWLALALLLSPLVLIAAQALRYESGARALQHEAAQLVRSVLHAGQAVPAEELRRRLRAMRAPEVHAAATQALFEAVAALPGARLEALEYRGTDGLRATLVHDAPDDLDTLRAALAANGWRLVSGGSVAGADGLHSELLLGPGS